MGVLINKFEELCPKIGLANKLANNVSIRPLSNQQNEKVYSSVRLLCPLSDKSHFVKSYADNGYGGVSYIQHVYVGEFIREKGANQRESALGSSIHEGRIVGFLKEHGDDIKPFVRPKISEPFSVIVECCKSLTQYTSKEMTFKKEFDMPQPFGHPSINIWADRNGATVNKGTINVVSINCEYPRQIQFKFHDKNNPSTMYSGYHSCRLDNTNDTFELEDFLDDIMEILEEAKAQIDIVKAHNKEYEDKIDDAVMPFKIAEELKPKMK